ncbi:MAG: MFS transporter [Prevotella sp.]|nr:MFS transporter [Prevotella sp.]MBR1462986.1 MFS transporter [Prevotella sp.]
MEKKTNVRWIVVGLLFFATTINYIDRQVIGLLKPYIQDDLHWSETDYGYIVTSFQIAYAIGMLACGRLLDKVGSKLGYSIAIIVWSLGAVLHAAVKSVMGFGVARAVLGLGEAGNFPAAVKTIAEWFPKKDRAYATGLFNSGSTIGAIIAPIIVVGITLQWGWRWAFIITGLLGFVWVIAWWLIYKSPHENPKVNAAELAYILSDEDNGSEDVKESGESGVTWRQLFRFKQTYAIVFSRFVTDWVWWFFLFWTPDFLNKTHGVDLKATVLPLIIIYFMSSIGGIYGGAVSSRFIKAGKSIDFARKTTILIFALLVLPLNAVPYIHNIWIVVLIIGLATSTHQAWASNIFTIVSDVYPKHVVASMTGISSVGGAIGGALASSFVGFILEWTGSYATIFMIASCMYLLAWLTLKLFVPIRQIKI